MKGWSGCSSEAEGAVQLVAKWDPLKVQDLAVVALVEVPELVAVLGGSLSHPFFLSSSSQPQNLLLPNPVLFSQRERERGLVCIEKKSKKIHKSTISVLN